jgi:hypothetical protein
MAIEVSEPPGSSEEVPKRGSRWPWLITIALVAVLAALVGGLIATRANDNSDGIATSQGTQQLASIQQACAQWRGGYTGGSAPSSAWCDEMVGWMTGQVSSGRMMGSMMWGDPDQMLATCQQWMASRPPASGSTPGTAEWCGQMVTWMTQHMGSWDQWDRGWMMNGPMMGR